MKSVTIGKCFHGETTSSREALAYSSAGAGGVNGVGSRTPVAQSPGVQTAGGEESRGHAVLAWLCTEQQGTDSWGTLRPRPGESHPPLPRQAAQVRRPSSQRVQHLPSVRGGSRMFMKVPHPPLPPPCPHGRERGKALPGHQQALSRATGHGDSSPRQRGERRAKRGPRLALLPGDPGAR